MRKLTKALALILSLALILTFPVGASAAAPDPVPDPTTDVLIDEDRIGSLTIYKVDLTNAEKDGVWDSSYVSTGVYDQDVYDTLIGATRAGDTDNSSDLGNSEQSFGYAIAGVEFTYLRIADIVQFTESTNDGSTSNHVEVLYGIDKTKGADFLKALGLDGGAKQYANAANTDKLDGTKYYYYQSDVLIDALNAALESNATTTKNALEAYVKANGGTAMPLTDAYGKTSAEDLELGLYVCVETKVPEMVVSSCNPFLLPLPMTNVSGGNSEDGGTYWIYDVTTFPKNLTGIPTLEKLLKESAADTGKNQGTKELTDGYAHTGTASDGDTIDYLITSTLPSITSASTYLSEYSFIDTLSKGIIFSENDVVSTESARQHKDATDLVMQPYQETVGTLVKSDHKGISNQYVNDDKCIVDEINLIRRLTPLECERLQGFPDGWTNILSASDSARYKALGNSVAIPCVEFVMQGLALVLKYENEIRRRRRLWICYGRQQRCAA